MNVRLTTRLNFLVALMVGASAVGIGGLSYLFLKSQTVENFQRKTSYRSKVTAQRLTEKIRQLAQKSNLLIEGARAKFRNRDAKLGFLKEQIGIDEQLLAVSIYEKKKDWRNALLVTRKKDDPKRLGSKEIDLLDAQSPIDFDQVARGDVLLQPVKGEEGLRLFRLAFPKGKSEDGVFTEVVVAEIHPAEIARLLFRNDQSIDFIADAEGTLLAQSQDHFEVGENLSHLPIIQMAQATRSSEGRLNYKEAPQSDLQYGGFTKVQPSNLIVVSQISEKELFAFLSGYIQPAVAVLGVFILLSLVLLFFAVKTHVSDRIKKLQGALNEFLEKGTISDDLEIDAKDEIGILTNQVKSMCAKLSEDSPTPTPDPRKLDSEEVQEFLEEEFGKGGLPKTDKVATIVKPDEEIEKEEPSIDIDLDEEDFGNMEEKFIARIEEAKETDREKDLKTLETD